MRSRRRRDPGESGPTITFDPVARHKFLTGFRKRKLDRKKKGHAQVAELERQDRINLKWEMREEVKKQWKEVQWAERRVEKLFGPDGRPRSLADKPGGDEDKPKKKRRRKADALEDAGNGEVLAAIADAASSGPVTVAFEAEDDDPFGGCEVTTVAALGDDAEGGPAAFDGPHTLAVPERNRGTELAIAGRALTPAELEARIRRRTEALRKEEAKRQVAMSKRITKQMAEKKKMKKKKGNSKKKGGKNAKTGARARRRRKTK